MLLKAACLGEQAVRPRAVRAVRAVSARAALALRLALAGEVVRAVARAVSSAGRVGESMAGVYLGINATGNG